MIDKEDDTTPNQAGIPWAVLSGILLVAVVLMVAAVAAVLHFTNVLDGDTTTSRTGQTSEVTAPGPERGQAVYVALDPPFVVNFEGKGPARFLQISVELMTRDSAMEEEIKKHTPAIRNNLVFLFGSQTYEDVETKEGKERLRNTALVEVQKILKRETGRPGIEALYFTSFVMQ